MPKRATSPATEYRHREFAKQFIVDFDGGAAVERCHGYKVTGHNATVAAGRLLKEERVQQYIREEMAGRNERVEIEQDKALRAQEQLAFWDVRSYIHVQDEKIVAKRIEDLTPEQAGAIAKVRVIQQDAITKTSIGEPKVIQLMRIEYELDNKHDAIQSLFRHLGLYEKDNKQIADIGHGLSSLLNYTRDRVNGSDESARQLQF